MYTLDQEVPQQPAPVDAAARELAVLDQMLITLVESRGSDLHLTVGIQPSVRIQGDIKPLTEFPVMTGSEIRRMIYAILTQKQREKFEEHHELDTSHSIPNRGRFRVNVFLQRDSVGAVLRLVPAGIPSLEDLGLPDEVIEWSDHKRGLVLVCGPHGSGTSTTLAAQAPTMAPKVFAA
jgi:twitching motility protein PilT